MIPEFLLFSEILYDKYPNTNISIISAIGFFVIDLKLLNMYELRNPNKTPNKIDFKLFFMNSKKILNGVINDITVF
jgi:hypothetical protein